MFDSPDSAPATLLTEVHAAVCTTTVLPLAWKVATAKDAGATTVPGLLDALAASGFIREYAVLDKGYDVASVYDACAERDIRPIIPLRHTPAVRAGRDRAPTCDHGTWTFAASDAQRGASKWSCPNGDCMPASVWVKADRLHPLVPRHTARFKGLYGQRGAVEREFGRLKHEWALVPLRVRRIERVRLHADLTILAKLASVLSHTRAMEVAA